MISVLSGLGREGSRPLREAPHRFPFAHLQRARRGPRGCWWPAGCLARPPLHACGETRVWAGWPACVASVRGRWCWRAGRAAHSDLCAGTPPGERPHRPHLQAQDGAGVSSHGSSLHLSWGPPRPCRRRKTLSPPPALSGSDPNLQRQGLVDRPGTQLLLPAPAHTHTGDFTRCQSACPTEIRQGPDRPQKFVKIDPAVITLQGKGSRCSLPSRSRAA